MVASADFGWDGPVATADLAALVGGDGASVGVADDVVVAVAPAGGEAGNELGGEVADRGGVVFAAVYDEPVSFGCQGRVDAAVHGLRRRADLVSHRPDRTPVRPMIVLARQVDDLYAARVAETKRARECLADLGDHRGSSA